MRSLGIPLLQLGEDVNGDLHEPSGTNPGDR